MFIDFPAILMMKCKHYVDIKARYRGRKYLQETLKYFRKNLIRLLLTTSLNIWALSVLLITLQIKSDPDKLAKVLYKSL